jgi:hypothetical protein
MAASGQSRRFRDVRFSVRYRRDHLRAFAQRVEVDQKELRIMESRFPGNQADDLKTELLRAESDLPYAGN